METALARLEPKSLEELNGYGKLFVESKMFDDVTSAAQAAVRIMAGQEIGIGPFEAMRNISIIKGKAVLGAGLIGALIKRSGRYNYRIATLSDTVCELKFYENGQEVGPSRFTISDAKQAGLVNNPTWQKFPRNMLLARAISNGARWYCPDVFGGAIYTAEELGEPGEVPEVPGVTVEESTGEVIEAEVAAEPEPAAPPADDKRRKVIEAIFGDWDERQELDAAFSTWKRRKNSIIGQMKAAWPAIETADMNDEEAVLHWLETADLEQVRTYGKHNRARLGEEREAAELAEEEPGDGE